MLFPHAVIPFQTITLNTWSGNGITFSSQKNVIFGNFKTTFNIHKIRKNGWYLSTEKFSRSTNSLRHNFFHERIKDTLASHLPGTPPSLPIWAPPLPPPPFQKGENLNAKTLILLVVIAINSLAWTWLPPAPPTIRCNWEGDF